MPVDYKIVADQKIAYVKAWGKVTADEILIQGARLFAENAWENGFRILCDYRKITEFNISNEDVRRIVDQDKQHEPLFDQSKCAVVAVDNLVFGLLRMWESLSYDNRLLKMIFRDMDEALEWLGVGLDFLGSMKP